MRLPKNNTGNPGDRWNNWMKLTNENKLDIALSLPQRFFKILRNLLKIEITISRAVGNKPSYHISCKA